MSNRKIRIKFANYALFDILKALKSSNIDEVTITKEDGNLFLVVDVDSSNCKEYGGCVVNLDENGYPSLDGCISVTEGRVHLNIPKESFEQYTTPCCEKSEIAEMKYGMC